jgi:glycosyltransferase involved in cell wall biosynthesis
MHICFLTNEYPKEGYPHGGIGTFVKTLGAVLIKEGHHVSVVGIGYLTINEFGIDNGIEVYRLAPVKTRRLKGYLNNRMINRQIAEIHLKNPIDIIETSEMGLSFVRKQKDIKYIIRLHGGHHFFAEAENRSINWWKGFQEKRSFRKADEIIGVSNYVIEHTSKYINFASKKGPAIYNPLDVNKFREAATHNTIPGYILFTGTICKKKGIKELILAMQIIVREIPNACLYVAGRDSKFKDGASYTNYLQQFITEDTAQHIKFLGNIPHLDMPGLLEKAEVCVFPSHMETFGLGAIEAMATGKPVVFTSKGPGPEVISDGITGLLCNPLDPQDIAEKTIRILRNPDYGMSMGKNARQAVIERFSAEKLVLQNIHFYQSLIK